MDLLYRAVLGRPVDPSGLAWQLDRLAAGSTPDAILDELLASTEAADRRRAVTRDAARALLSARWHDAAAPTPPLVFLHVMKTAGTSLKTALKSWWQPDRCLIDLFLDDLVLLPDRLLRAAPLITGHLPFEALRVLPGPVRSVAVLRDPVERTLSHYIHLRDTPAVRREQEELSLDEFLAAPRWSTLATNYQARHLGHEIGLSEAWVTYSPPQRFAALGPPFPPDHELPLQSLFDCTPLPGDDCLFRAASAHLDAIDHVGTTERLSSLVEEVAAALGRRPPGLDRLNVSTGRLTAADLPHELRRRIQAQNAVDQELYDRARTRR